MVSNSASLRLRRYRRKNQGFHEDLGEGVRLTMMRIPAGQFWMGAPEDEAESRGSERPQHKVTVPEFFMGRYAITQAQWRVVTGYPRIDRHLKPDPSYFENNDNRPVECVSWEEAQEFCRRLSQGTGRVYRLPSEAEWEYACRAGTKTPFHFGKILSVEIANCDVNESQLDAVKQAVFSNWKPGVYRWKTTEVGQFPANEWGLHDMHGNVWEWCEDDWHDNYEGAPPDGSAWLKENRTEIGKMDSDTQEENRTEIKLLRGGSWNLNPWFCRAASRYLDSRVGRGGNCGFRVVCVAPSAL